MSRIIMYVSDIQIITGKTERQARYLLLKIKKYYRKGEQQCLTVKEFCHYMGIPEEDVRPFLR